MLIPPINFALVVDGVYRSGHPIDHNLPFLKTLDLKTIIYVGDRTDEENSQYIEWATRENITYIHVQMPTVKEPFVMNDPEPVTQCLELLCDKSRYPILVHSNKGKHRVGVLVGVLRKVQQWALSSIYQEYLRFAKGKADADVLFIEQYVPSTELLSDYDWKDADGEVVQGHNGASGVQNSGVQSAQGAAD